MPRYRASGPVGPLHGIPVIIKDQADEREMPTTLGSVLFQDHRPERDCFVAAQLSSRRDHSRQRRLWASSALATRMARSSARPAILTISRARLGGSSGGPAASVSANFATAGGSARKDSPRSAARDLDRIAGMRPERGLVTAPASMRAGRDERFAWPMARTVTDLAELLDVMVGYDPDDPVTAHGVGRAPKSYAAAPR